MCLLNFIYTSNFCLIQKVIYHLQKNWPYCSLPKFCRSSIYVITIVKFSNRSIQNLFNLLQQTSMDFCKVNNNNLVNSDQFGFRPGDSRVHQLIPITHDIYKAFDANPSLEMRRAFLELSRAFDKVWHEGLLYKLRPMGIYEHFFALVDSFLSDRFQSVLLNDQT